MAAKKGSVTRRVLISNPEGEEYSVTEAVFLDQYEPMGFTAGLWEDTRTPYGEDAEPEAEEAKTEG